MLKVSEPWIQSVDAEYPGFREQLLSREAAMLPACPHCSSPDTASVITGVIGRTMSLAAGTTKVKLAANNRPGRYCCNSCGQFS